MKLGIFADPHLSQNSSIVVGRKGSFIGRLDNLIKSFEWMNSFFKSNNVDVTICLGDMTDKPNLSSEEITALSKCGLEDCYFIVGNHCRSNKSGSMNSLSLFNNVIYEPQFLNIPGLKEKVYLLPYTNDEIELPEADIILSHCDLLNYDFGCGHLSKSGIDINDAVSKCKLLVNGHIHQGECIIKDKIYNLGVISGVNFSSCNNQWEPSVGIIDTETCTLSLYENPYAYKFKKTSQKTLSKVKTYLNNLEGSNYILQIKVPSSIVEPTRQLINQNSKIEAARVLSIPEKKDNNENETLIEFDLKSSITDKFKNFLKEKDSDISLNDLYIMLDSLEDSDEQD